MKEVKEKKQSLFGYPLLTPTFGRPQPEVKITADRLVNVLGVFFVFQRRQFSALGDASTLSFIPTTFFSM